MRQQHVTADATSICFFLEYQKNGTLNQSVRILKNNLPFHMNPWAICQDVYQFSINKAPSAPFFQHGDGSPIQRRQVEEFARSGSAPAFQQLTLHSPRVGFVNEMMFAGYDRNFIAAFGRWKSSAVDDYMRFAFHDISRSNHVAIDKVNPVQSMFMSNSTI